APRTCSKTNEKQNIEVNALSGKQVQTYALSLGAGFVGVAGSVSVWSVGTEANSNYNDGAGGPEPAPTCAVVAPNTWCSGQTYNKSDVVTFNRHKFASKTDGHVGHTPNSDGSPSTDWEGQTDSLAPASDGTPACLPGCDKGTWSSGASYNTNDVVTYNGSQFQARKAVGPSATPPPNDLDHWLGVSK